MAVKIWTTCRTCYTSAVMTSLPFLALMQSMKCACYLRMRMVRHCDTKFLMEP